MQWEKRTKDTDIGLLIKATVISEYIASSLKPKYFRFNYAK